MAAAQSPVPPELERARNNLKTKCESLSNNPVKEFYQEELRKAQCECTTAKFDALTPQEGEQDMTPRILRAVAECMAPVMRTGMRAICDGRIPMPPLAPEYKKPLCGCLDQKESKISLQQWEDDVLKSFEMGEAHTPLLKVAMNECFKEVEAQMAAPKKKSRR
ncbi:hypothetical protein V8J88_13695 [Massilia sp. W12]|uniref:hypothetical protein n=1 Tax=Massilia sp. W12 TaxID=3126507 RepID=UPI0030D0C2B7